MKSFAREYVLSEKDAEDIVQDIFIELYEKDKKYDPVNQTAYLFTSIKNRCIDHLRRKKLEQEAANHLQEEYFLTLRMKLDSLEILDLSISDREIEKVLEEALQSLPERCRAIFIKHKIEGEKQKEIAEELRISPKTVENQLTIAYKKLRIALKNYAPLIFLLLNHY